MCCKADLLVWCGSLHAAKGFLERCDWEIPKESPHEQGSQASWKMQALCRQAILLTLYTQTCTLFSSNRDHVPTTNRRGLDTRHLKPPIVWKVLGA